MAERKYHNVPTVVDGYAFDSQREARRWRELVLLARAGEIRELERQPVYPLHAPVRTADGALVVGAVKVSDYIADFRYRDRRLAWALIVEDAKGVRTPVYRLKKRHLAAEYGIAIVEV